MFLVILFYYELNYLYIVVLHACSTKGTACFAVWERRGRARSESKGNPSLLICLTLWFYEYCFGKTVEGSLVTHIVAVLLIVWLQAGYYMSQ